MEWRKGHQKYLQQEEIERFGQMMSKGLLNQTESTGTGQGKGAYNVHIYLPIWSRLKFLCGKVRGGVERNFNRVNNLTNTDSY